MRQPERRGLLAVLLVAALGGCNFYYDKVPSPDDALKLVPWFDHMIKSQAIHPYQRADIPRHAVPGSVALHRLELDWRDEFARGVTTTADALANPTLGDVAATLAKGDTLFQVYCSMCHGPSGNLGGTISHLTGAPSLQTDLARGRSDGYLYSIIRYGRGVMGRYGDKIVRPEDRWAVVNYVRQLQAQDTPAGGAN
ncbi:MAG: cytochrome c [Gemmatimonadales bacterium]